MTQKKSIADLIRRAGPTTPEMRAAAVIASLDDHQKMMADWNRTKASPQWRAMERLHAALHELKNDPEISVSEPCTDVLELVLDLLKQAWPHHDLARIVSPMQKHFDGVKSKEANDKRKEMLAKQRDLYHNFLDQQHDIADTVRLAARLRKAFEIKAVRGSEDTVRAWRNLHSPGKT